MAVYDSQTQDFIKKVVGDNPEDQERVKRQAIGAAKQVMSQGAKRGLAGVVLGTAVGKAVRSIDEEKTAAAQMV
jgi:hypothetical protein